MKIAMKLNRYGCKDDNYDNQVGLDIASPVSLKLSACGGAIIDLQTHIAVPAGHQAYLVARSSWALKGLIVNSVPIDPGYSGPLHAMVLAISDLTLTQGDYFCQLVMTPIVGIEPVTELKVRGDNNFGSTTPKRGPSADKIILDEFMESEG